MARYPLPFSHRARAPRDAANTLRLRAEFDSEVADPARDRGDTGRGVFAAICEQLLDMNDKLDFVAQLATATEWRPDDLALKPHRRRNFAFQGCSSLDELLKRDTR